MEAALIAGWVIVTVAIVAWCSARLTPRQEPIHSGNTNEMEK